MRPWVRSVAHETSERWVAPIALGGLLCVLVVASLAPTSQAAFPGRDGRIAFVWQRGGRIRPQSCGDIFTVDASGSGLQRVTSGCPWQYSDPTFSANGKRLAAVRSPIASRAGPAGIYVMDPSGAHLERIIGSTSDEQPGFSPNGRWLVFDGVPKKSKTNQIFIARSDGSSIRQLTHDTYDTEATFSPNGGEIAFARLHGRGTVFLGTAEVDVYTMHPDGSHVHELTHAPGGISDGDPDFSPNGKQIAFRCGLGNLPEICIMRSNGTRQQQLTRFGTSGFTAANPTFSPDGSKIAFAGQGGCRPVGGCTGPVILYTMRSDGSNLKQVYTLDTHQSSVESAGIAWQPVH